LSGSAPTSPKNSGNHAAPPATDAVHAESLDTLLERLEASSSEGLSRAVAAARLARVGPNALPEPPSEPTYRRLLAQFTNPLVLTLIAAASVAVFVGMTEATGGFLARFSDALAILLIVVVNALIGFYQERRAEAALDALRKLAAPNARVRRDGVVVECLAAELVPGDLVELEAGDAVPADARLVQTFGFATEESALTGETVPRLKDALASVDVSAPLAERDTMVFTGTSVVRGRARAVVTHTGERSELGRIGTMIASIGQQKTPLEERLDAFGKVVLWGCLALSSALLAWGLMRPGLVGGAARSWHVLLLDAVALAVAAIPEGLPAITTITLALGMQRMARRGAIVRKLPAVETLGAATVICSDKTGTLTQNEMCVREVYTVGRRIAVTGTGYEARGELRDEGGAVIAQGQLPQALEELFATASLCNNARIAHEAGVFRVIGDPTEGALLVLAEKGGVIPESVRATSVVLTEVPFDSDRKRMTVVARDERGRELVHVKGSVDSLLPRSVRCVSDEGPVPLTQALRESILAEATRMSQKALRVLAIGRREHHATGDLDDPERIERELTFLGLVGMMDPPRPGVAEAVATCIAAGIRPVMITGDDRVTARAIAEEIGMWQAGDEAVTGAELEAMTDEELDRHAGKLKVFARTTPEQKLRIVRAFKRAGHVVAMTGDGVNDAPALREANIGVAMGKMGTDVARQAADLVLADDNFATIVHAVREGRAIYRNIQKFIFFLLSANMGLVVTVFTVSFFAHWPPLTPLMVLWVNLVTNGLPALALGIDPPDDCLMEEAPRNPTERLMVFRDYLGMLFVGAVMGGAAVAMYLLVPTGAAGSKLLEDGYAKARALAFTVLALSPLIHAFSCRSPIRSVLQSRPLFSPPLFLAVLVSTVIHLVAVLVPALQPIFRTDVPLSFADGLLVAGFAALVLPAVELAKLANRGWLRARGLASLALFVALTVFAPSADARSAGLRAERVDEPIELDGVLEEWHGRFRDVDQVQKGGTGSAGDLAARVAVAYDDKQLYLAADVTDDRLVAGSDFVELALGIPGGTLVSLRFFPGEPGRTRAVAKLGTGAVIEGGRVVEARTAGGYTLEASVPWARIPKSDRIRIGYRAVVRVHDADGGAVESVVATSRSPDYGAMPPLSLEAELSLGANLLRQRGLTMPPRTNVLADVVGDGMLERVLVYDRFLVVLGPTYREGRQYFFRDLGAGPIVRIKVEDVNGDGKSDVIVERKPPEGAIVETLAFERGSETPSVIDVKRLAVATVALPPPGASPSFSGGAPSAAGAPAMPRGATDVRDTSSGTFATAKAERPMPPSADAVYELYQRRRKVTGKPSFDLRGDLDEDGREERLVVHGADLVVFGPGFRGGRSFTAMTLELDPGSLESVVLRDVDGDGKAEVVVTARKAPGGPTASLVLRLRDGQFQEVR